VFRCFYFRQNFHPYSVVVVAAVVAAAIVGDILHVDS
jgi:hypothetical protein